jgi:DNA-binding NarL/FixJ family response regulator
MRILLADDQPVVRYALRVLLERQPGVLVVGEAGDVTGLLAAAQSVNPHLILLDWELPGMRAARVLTDLRKVRPELLVIALSGRPEARQAAMDHGVNAFVSKADPPERLLAAIGAQGRSIPGGSLYFS